MEMIHKRGPSEAAINVNGVSKRSKLEMESFSSGIGSKSKPCTKFFSTSGCPFGESCHFLHYVPGGVKTSSSLASFNAKPTVPPAPRRKLPPNPFNGPSPSAVKTRLCNKYSTAEGCKFGEHCHFAHGEWELGKPMQDARGQGRFPVPADPPATGFGVSANVKISVDASLVGAVLGKGGANSKHVCRVTGARLLIRDHESDSRLRNIELEGSLEQIKQASAMVSELIQNVGSGPAAPARMLPGPANNFKTKLCENFASGSCTFGERCHFAHGLEELRKF